MPKIQKIIKFHNDDIKLSLELPENYIDYTHLNLNHIDIDFEAFAKVLFDNILTKDKRNFRIIFDEETQTHEIFIPAE